MAEELLPCPMCGGVASDHEGLGEFWVRCVGCMVSTTMFNSRAKAEAAWNRRAALPRTGEPAAWRIRPRNSERSWMVMTIPPSQKIIGDDWWEVQPLFAFALPEQEAV